MGRNDKGYRLRFLLLAIAVLQLCLFVHSPEVEAVPNRTFIFVVDSSEAMTPYLPTVKDMIASYAQQAKRGDYIAVIACSNSARLLTTRKIATQNDWKPISTMLDALTPSGDTAEIGWGVSRALEEVETLKRRGDANVKGIILISASVAPEGGRSGEEMAKASQRIGTSVSDDEWYIQYCYLGGVRDPEVDSFVTRNHGLSYDIDQLRSQHGSEIIEELYRITAVPEEVCALRLLDLTGQILQRTSPDTEWAPVEIGSIVPEGSRVRVPSDSRVVLEVEGYGKLGLAPETDVTVLGARSAPWTAAAVIHIALEDGSLWSSFDGERQITLRADSAAATVDVIGTAHTVMSSAGGASLRIVSFDDRTVVSVKGGTPGEPFALERNKAMVMTAGAVPLPPEPADVAVLEQWKSWGQALRNNVRLASLKFEVPKVRFGLDVLEMGPIKPGQVQDKKFPLKIEGVENLSDLKMEIDVSLDLPEGLYLSTGVADGEKPGTKALFVKVDGSGEFRALRGNTYKGLLRIAPAPDSGAVFEKISAPLVITTKGALFSSPMVIGAVSLLILGAAVIGAIFAFRGRKTIHSRPHRVMGRLIVVSEPSRSRVGSINLDEISTKSSRLSLVIGRSRTVEIRFKHASVEPEHCTIEALLADGRLLTFIEPIGSAKVLVNDKPVSSRVQLNDGAKIQIGEFVYQFEDTQLYKKVHAVYRNGRSISGVLDASGIDADGFKISPMDAVSPSERARIKFSDISYVTFYRRAADILAGTPRPPQKTQGMKRLELMFKKGNTISGYVQREYTEGRNRYIELLPLDPESDIDYTIVEYSSIIEKKTL
ncbi:MAG: hypothetical protein Kow0099_18720 [Candidatus Abyssubacteria bacterium]